MSVADVAACRACGAMTHLRVRVVDAPVPICSASCSSAFAHELRLLARIDAWLKDIPKEMQDGDPVHGRGGVLEQFRRGEWRTHGPEKEEAETEAQDAAAVGGEHALRSAPVSSTRLHGRDDAARAGDPATSDGDPEAAAGHGVATTTDDSEIINGIVEERTNDATALKGMVDDLIAYVSDARRQERELCAKVADDYAPGCMGGAPIAAAIRRLHSGEPHDPLKRWERLRSSTPFAVAIEKLRDAAQAVWEGGDPDLDQPSRHFVSTRELRELGAVVANYDALRRDRATTEGDDEERRARGVRQVAGPGARRDSVGGAVGGASTALGEGGSGSAGGALPEESPGLTEAPPQRELGRCAFGALAWDGGPRCTAACVRGCGHKDPCFCEEHMPSTLRSERAQPDAKFESDLVECIDYLASKGRLSSALFKPMLESVIRQVREHDAKRTPLTIDPVTIRVVATPGFDVAAFERSLRELADTYETRDCAPSLPEYRQVAGLRAAADLLAKRSP